MAKPLLAKLTHPNTFLLVVIGAALFVGVWAASNSLKFTSKVSLNTPSSSMTETRLNVASDAGVASQVGQEESVQAMIANFYASFRERDRERLGSFFTADNSADNLTHQRLFLGEGDTPALLFSDVAANQSVADYSLLGLIPENQQWVATVREDRVNALGSQVGTATTLLTLVPAPSGEGTWLIDSYIHSGATGKYSGFLVQ